MAKNTVRELTEQLTDLRRNTKSKIKKLEEQREKAVVEEQFDEGASNVFNLYKSYIKAGFTEAQAWELLLIQFGNATKTTLF